MRDLSLPDGFQANWEGGTLRIVLPEMVQTTSHRFEPILSKADAQRLATEIGEHEKARQADPGPAPGFAPLTKIVLQREPDFSLESATKFRERVVLALYDVGLHPKLELSVAPLAPEAQPVPPEPVLPEPRLPRIGMTTPVPTLPLESAAPASPPATPTEPRRVPIDPLAETDHEIELDIEVLTAMSTPPPPAPAMPAAPHPAPAAAPPPAAAKAPPTPATANGTTIPNPGAPNPGAPTPQTPATPASAPAPTPARKKLEAPIPTRKRFERHGAAK